MLERFQTIPKKKKDIAHKQKIVKHSQRNDLPYDNFGVFQFFHKHYWNNSSGKLIAAVLEPVIWKGRNYGNLLHCYVLYEKTIVAGRKQGYNLKTLEKYRCGILKKVQDYRVEAQIGQITRKV